MPCTGKPIRPGRGGLLGSVTHRKTASNMGRTLDFVGKRNGKILKRNPAFAVGGGQKLVGPEAELAGPLAGGEQRRGRQKRPVQLPLLPQQVEEGGAFLGLR